VPEEEELDLQPGECPVCWLEKNFPADAPALKLVRLDVRADDGHWFVIEFVPCQDAQHDEVKSA
jgi:hypothetical protein